MKKKTKSISEYITAKNIYLEEILEIEEIFKENGFSYVIEVEDYELNSSNEFSQLPKSIKKTNSIQIIARKDKDSEESFEWHHITVQMQPFSKIRIYSADSDTICLGIINKIKIVLKENKIIKFLEKFADWKSYIIYWTVTVIHFCLVIINTLLKQDKIFVLNSLVNIESVLYLIYVVLFIANIFYIGFRQLKYSVYLTSIENHKNDKKYGWVWSIVGVFLGVLAIIASFTTKEIRCLLKLDVCNVPSVENQNNKKLPNNKK